MLRPILGLFVLCSLTPTIEDRPIKALDAWLKLYRAGKIDYTSEASIAKDSLAVKFGLLQKNALGTHTWEADLTKIVDDVAALNHAEAANTLLQVATIGIDAGKFEYHMAPSKVRVVGEGGVAKLTSAPAKEEVAKAARGDSKTDKASPAAWQAAAVRCLGLMKDPAMRGLVETTLADPDDIVRISAAEALANLGDENSSLALVNALDREANDAVLITIVSSLKLLFAKYVAAPVPPPAPSGDDTASAPSAEPAAPAELPEGIRLAVRAAIKALGKTTWRADMALLGLLDEFRSLESVPALIGVLERFRDRPEDLKSGKLSGMLMFRAHELLVAMTGAILPADQPAKWRELWEREKDQIKLAAKPVARGPDATVAGGFCGIPVQGTRVVFILDLSGSMEWEVIDKDTAGREGKKGIEYAKEELERAMTSIAPNAQFSLVTFNGEAEASVWSKDLVPATEKNRDRFVKYVRGLTPKGGTNLWAGIEEALSIKSEVFGARYECTVDEVFILSDGAPSVGRIIDPHEILRVVKESNRFASVRFNTIFLGNRPPKDWRGPPTRNMTMTPEELMKQLAEQNGGKFRAI